MIKKAFRKLIKPYLNIINDEINRLDKRLKLLEKSSNSNATDTASNNWQITFSNLYSTSEKPTKELLTKDNWADLTKNNACFQGRPDDTNNTWLMVSFDKPRNIQAVKLRPLTGEIKGGWSATYLNGAKVQVLKNGNWIDCLTVSGHTDSEHKIISHAINQTDVTAIKITRNSYMALSYFDID